VTLAIEVNFESLHTVLESGVEKGDIITLITKKPSNKPFSLLIRGKRLKNENFSPFSDLISSLKKKCLKEKSASE